MNFNTPAYGVLLLVAFWGYWLSRRQSSRVAVLLVISYVFYAAWSPSYLGLIAAITLLTWWAALRIARSERPATRRGFLVIALVGSLGALCVCKYLGFFILEANRLCLALGMRECLPVLRILLPVGISFYTFQAVGYIVDVYRGHVEAERNLVVFATFVAFFPQLVAGPILRAKLFLPQLRAEASLVKAQAMDGTHRILRGLLKKAIFADLVGAFAVDPVFAAPHEYGTLAVLVAIYGYAVQIYCDFSAYTDIAIGSARLFGLHVPENFNYPYLAGNLREFWHRWHMSLSTWLRDYLYIPLGGSRLGAVRTHVNLLVTMLLGGLWHGANWTFVVWGAIHGVMLALTRLVQGRRAEPGEPSRAALWLGRMATFHLVCLGWVFFRATDLANALDVLEALARPSAEVAIKAAGPVALGLALHFGHGPWKNRIVGVWLRMPIIAQAAIAVLILALVALAGQEANAFIYFQF
ncbi:MAG TPA: MBOAT family protein [Armatimonadota bacterium]|nr:MBOAT family protein [Armatimonadota bacterium]